MTISSTTRKAGPYIGNGTASVFPFAFKVFQASDVEVVRLNVATSVETTLALTTDYTVTLNLDQDSNPGGNITLVAGPLASGFNLVLTSDIGNLQPTDLTNQGGFYPDVINDALDRATIQIQQLQEQTDRAIKVPITNPTTIDELTADLIRVANSADNVDTVANHIDNVDQVADSIDNVDTVSGSIANVNTVAGHIANVDTVGTHIANVDTAATHIANIDTVANDLNEPVSEINTVAENIGNVNTVGLAISNVNSVATDIANVNTVANDLNEPVSEINTVAVNIANVNAVGNDITNVNTVAGNTTNINTVAGISGNVTTVAGNNANVTTVATNIASVNSAATNMAAIIAAPTQAANAAASATSASTSAGNAVIAKNAAEAARDAALVSGKVYASTAAGIAATTNGQYFSVPSVQDVEYLILYLNNAGTAVEIKRYPSTLALSAFQQINYGPKFVVTDSLGYEGMLLNDEGGFLTKKLQVEGDFKVRTGADVEIDTSGNFDSNTSYIGNVAGAGQYLYAITDDNGNAIIAIDSQGRLVANFDLVPSGGGGGSTGTRVYDYSINQVFGYGQSLSVGQTETALSTVQHYDNLMFTRGMRPQYDYPGETDAQWYASLVPAVEAVSPTMPTVLCETTMVGIGDMIKQRILSEDGKSYTQHQYQMLLSTPGWGATTVAQLSKGGSYYPRMITQTTYAKNLASAAGKTHAVQAVTWTQGESDYLSGTSKATYMAQLNQLIADFNADIKAITGQSKNIPMISYQISSHKYYGGGTSYPQIAFAQYDVEATNPLYYIACAMYPFTYWAGGHIVAQSTRWLGAYYGLAYKRIVINQEDWVPLKPIASVRQSNFVEIRFNVPQGPIVFDTTQVPAQTNYGFRLFDSAGNAQTITNVAIIDTDRIRITASATIPAGSRVRYACEGNSITGLGNLRDSQGDTITFDCITATKRMDNWCLIFDLEV